MCRLGRSATATLLLPPISCILNGSVVEECRMLSEKGDKEGQVEVLTPLGVVEGGRKD